MAPKEDSDKVESSTEALINTDLVYKKIISNQEYLESLPSTVSIEDLPDWYDEKLFKLGQEYARCNLFSSVNATILGLLNVFITPEMITLLQYTRQSSTPCAAFKRYLQTIKHHLTFYTTDINDPNSTWWKSLNTIRWKHATINQKTDKRGIGKFPQLHMILTQFGPIGYVLLNQKSLGFTNESEYREGFIHLWRVVGYLLGIPDEINLCRENSARTASLCERILNDYFVGFMKESIKDCDQIIKPVLNGLWYIDMTIDIDATMYFWHKLNGLEYKKSIKFYSWFICMLRSGVFYFLGIPYIQHPIRCALNYIMKMSLWAAEHFPLFAWIKFGKQKSKIHLYPIPFNKSE